MIVVGLTGGIGSGKSTVAEFFEVLNVPVYNSDKEARKLMKSSKKVKKAIISLLGKEAYKGKKLNKPYISSKIFKDKRLLQKMNTIVHPAVREHFLGWKKKQNAVYVIQETALIFENDAQQFYDKIILVVAPELDRINRVSDRDQIAESDIKKRMESQLMDEDKIPLAHYVINNVILSDTKQKVADIHAELLDFRA